MFGTMLLMMFLFVNEGLDLVDLDHFLPQGLKILLLVIMKLSNLFSVIITSAFLIFEIHYLQHQTLFHCIL